MNFARLASLAFLPVFLAVFGADTPPAGGAPPKPAPVIDPANQLAGKALADALRGGGYVLFMRHAKYAKITEQCTETNLAPDGEAEARKVGAELRSHRVPIGVVRPSKMCRAIETAKLLDVAPVEPTADVNPASEKDLELHAARRKLLAEVPPRGTNTLLVSHVQNSEDRNVQLTLALCEIIVFKPDGRGGAVPIARIKPEDWAELPK